MPRALGPHAAGWVGHSTPFRLASLPGTDITPMPLLRRRRHGDENHLARPEGTRGRRFDFYVFRRMCCAPICLAAWRHDQRGTASVDSHLMGYRHGHRYLAGGVLVEFHTGYAGAFTGLRRRRQIAADCFLWCFYPPFLPPATVCLPGSWAKGSRRGLLQGNDPAPLKLLAHEFALLSCDRRSGPALLES